MSDARSAIPGLAVVAQASGLDPTSLQDLLKATGKLLGFFGAGYLVYGSYGGAVPREYGVAWAWDFVDTFYFTSATLTTVGYGDMPTLPQGLRLVTAFFGLVGVTVIASSLSTIADWCARAPPAAHRRARRRRAPPTLSSRFLERARKRFMKKMEVVLREAQVAGEIVRQARGTTPAAEDSVKRRKSADARAAKKKSIVAAPGAPFTHAATHGAGCMRRTSTTSTRCRRRRRRRRRPPPRRSSGPAMLRSFAPAGHHPGLPPPRKKRPRLQYSLAVLSAVAPCLLFVVLCQVLGVIENAMYACEATCPE